MGRRWDGKQSGTGTLHHTARWLCPGTEDNDGTGWERNITWFPIPSQHRSRPDYIFPLRLLPPILLIFSLKKGKKENNIKRSGFDLIFSLFLQNGHVSFVSPDQVITCRHSSGLPICDHSAGTPRLRRQVLTRMRLLCNTTAVVVWSQNEIPNRHTSTKAMTAS